MGRMFPVFSVSVDTTSDLSNASISDHSSRWAKQDELFSFVVRTVDV